MSAAAPPVPVPGAAGWILAAGAALSLHVAAGAALVLALAAPPQAPAAAHGGVVIRNITAVTATAPRAGRARAAPVEARRADTAPGDRLAALDEAVPRRAAEAPARTAALAPGRTAGAQDTPRRLAPAAAAPRATGEPAPRRVAPGAQDRQEAAQAAPRRVAPGARDRQEATQAAPRRVAPATQDRQEAAQEIAPRRVAQETPEDAGAAAAVRRLSAGGARRAATDAARPAPPGDTVRPQAAPQRTPQRALQRAPQHAPETRAGRTPERSRSAIAPPPEPAPRRSRARRAGPDRRLSDRQAAPARDAGAVALEQIRTVLADLHGAPCHLVLPLPEGMPGFAAIGADPARLAAAAARLDRAFGRETRPVLATHAVAGGQCAAVDFVRASRDDPRRGLGLDLWRPAAGEGRPLTGTLLHGAAGALSLLLIDSAGRVHDLGGFLRPVPDGSHFSIPMSGAGAAGEARQLLLAIATPVPLQTLPPAASPTAAAPLFADLAQELERLGLVADLALAAFVLE
ncbi:hypothetical protein [Roseovarius ramblicola]|uniref:Uncharacterized protein n=1 Tax=Roseovarius ramblicola TaxID=2022336 RepID=A0ABV5I3M3_9RHOB